MNKTSCTALKASDVIKRLQELVAENGDLEITIDTREGAAYALFCTDDIEVIECTCKDGSKVKMIEIG